MSDELTRTMTNPPEIRGRGDSWSGQWEGDGIWSDEAPEIVEEPVAPGYDMRKLYRESTTWECHDAVTAWEKGVTDTIMWQDESGKEVFAPGTCPGGPNLGKPFFQFLPLHKSFEEGGSKVAESDNCISFIPAGFRGGKTPNTMNPVREDIGGPSALMSLVHVLTIPKDVRIYNAATLTHDHQPLLQEMKELGEKAVMILMKGSKDMMGSFKWQYSQDGEVEMSDGTMQSAKVLETDLTEKCQKNYHKKIRDPSILNSFHVYPAASIGYLHLHSYVGELLTTAHDTMSRDAKDKGYHKNVPYDVVVKQLSQ
jgi:hypothetical protein